jgi:natural product precursor
MKKLRKLQLKKVTLRNLDEPNLGAVAGGATGTCDTACRQNTCPTVCNYSYCIPSCAGVRCN